MLLFYILVDGIFRKDTNHFENISNENYNQVINLFTSIFPCYRFPDRFTKDHSFIFSKDSSPAGFMICRPLEYDLSHLIILYLGVAESKRGSGIGRALLQRVFNLGFKCVTSLNEAIGFYIRNGFTRLRGNLMEKYLKVAVAAKILRLDHNRRDPFTTQPPLPL